MEKRRKTSSKTSNPNPTPRLPITYQKDKPEWLLNNTKPPPDKKNNAPTWNEHPWYWCSPETGGQCEGKWHAHQPVECKGTSFLASKRKEESNPRANKHLKLTQAMQTVLDQKHQDYQDEDEEEWDIHPLPPPFKSAEPMQGKDIKKYMKRRWSKRLRRSLKYLKVIGTINFFPKKKKLGNWVNDLMHNSSMKNPLSTCLTAIAMTSTTDPRRSSDLRGSVVQSQCPSEWCCPFLGCWMYWRS